MIKKIIAFIIYGHSGQMKTNLQQFRDYKQMLHGFNVVKYNFHTDKSKILNDFRQGKIDIVVKNAYGRGNEADIELFLEKYKIPFLGSKSKATLACTSKYLSKNVFRKNNTPVIKDVYITKTVWQKDSLLVKKIISEIGFPCLIKAIDGTDSRGLYLVKNGKALRLTILKALSKHKELIVEKFIKDAYEVTCLVAGNKKLTVFEPVGLMKIHEMFFTALSKDSGKINIEFPTRLNSKIVKKIKEISKKAHVALNCRDFSRSDILVKGNKLFLLEVDVHPGFRKVSPTVLSLKQKKITLNQLFLSLINK